MILLNNMILGPRTMKSGITISILLQRTDAACLDRKLVTKELKSIITNRRSNG
jgi:hypothetical protein